jgi:hypothetical protein
VWDKLVSIESVLPGETTGPGKSGNAAAKERVRCYWRMRDATDPVSFGQAMLAWSDLIEEKFWKATGQKVSFLSSH